MESCCRSSAWYPKTFSTVSYSYVGILCPQKAHLDHQNPKSLTRMRPSGKSTQELLLFNSFRSAVPSILPTILTMADTAPDDTAPADDVQSFGCDPTPLPSTIPKEMKRLIVTSPGNGTLEDCKLEIETVPTPTPTYGQVLIKVLAAPINPSDYRSWYKSRPSAYPMPIGSEGSGVVVATGGILPDIRCPVGTTSAS